VHQLASDAIAAPPDCCPQAMNRMSAVCVPLYESLGDNAIEYIVSHAATKLVFAQVRGVAVVQPCRPTSTKLVSARVYGVAVWPCAPICL